MSRDELHRSGERGIWPPETFLGDLPAAEQELLLSEGFRRWHGPGSTLLVEGDPSDHVMILIEGFVKVQARDGDHSVLLAVRGPGDLVGETAALTSSPRSATVVAVGEGATLTLTGGQFLRFVEHSTAGALTLARVMARRLSSVNHRLIAQAAHGLNTRLARVLLELGWHVGRRVPSGGVEIQVQLSQAELASLVGAAEVTVQKAIRNLREAGLIETGYRRITIKDWRGLRAIADIRYP